MITYGNGMWERFSGYGNFDLAETEASRHKTKRPDVVRFREDRERNIRRVMDWALSPGFRVSPYRRMIVHDTKRREVFVLPHDPDRIVGHAVLNILIPYYMRLFGRDSYSCIPGRGQHAASARTMEYVRRYPWCYESDVRKCFPSIDHDILSRLHWMRFRDRRFLELNDRIIYSFPGPRNCPIGNATSQWYMNFYLNEWDKMCDHTLHMPHVRFCDNMNVYCRTLDDAKRARDATEEFCARVLKLDLSKSDIRKCADGIDFTGYRHFPDGRLLLRKSTLRRQRRRLRELAAALDAGTVPKERALAKIDSTLGWWKHAQTGALIKASGILDLRSRCA